MYEKINDKQFKSTETKEEIKTFNIIDLKNDRKIYVDEIAQYQSKIDAIDLLLTEAENLGVVAEVEEVTP